LKTHGESLSIHKNQRKTTKTIEIQRKPTKIEDNLMKTHENQ